MDLFLREFAPAINIGIALILLYWTFLCAPLWIIVHWFVPGSFGFDVIGNDLEVLMASCIIIGNCLMTFVYLKILWAIAPEIEENKD